MEMTTWDKVKERVIKLKILCACEESQAVTIELRNLGHEAYSCDLMECSGGHPEWHIQGDVIPLLNGNCTFTTCDGKEHAIAGAWDMLIAFPPCTDLASSGAAWFEQKRADGRQQKSVEFFMRFVNADCPKIAIENPVGIMSSQYRKPDQIIQPYEYGHEAKKTTCLWLKGINRLIPTDIVSPGEFYISPKGKRFSKGSSSDMALDENGKILSWKDPRTAKIRSKTYQGIARAMSAQWCGECKREGQAE